MTRRRWAALTGAVTALTLATSVLLHSSCLAAYGDFPPASAPRCMSDFRALWALRRLRSHAFPYLHPGPFGLPHGTVEYPTLTGLFAWLCALPVATPRGFYVVSVLALGLAGVVTGAVLGHEFGARSLMWAVSPVLLLSGFQNWDLLVCLAAVLGLVAWRRDRYAVAAVCFAVGACLKVFPALFLLVLLDDRRRARDRRNLMRAGAVSVAVVAAANLPFLVLAPDAWWQVVTFQGARPIDASAFSVWALFPLALTIPLVNAGSLALLAAGTAVVLFRWSRGAGQSGRCAALAACGALTVLVLLTGKADSPQYLLWLAPFFVVVRALNWRLWVVVGATAVVSWWALYQVVFVPWQAVTPGQHRLFVAAVVGRTVVLAGVLGVLVRAAGGAAAAPVMLSGAALRGGRRS